MSVIKDLYDGFIVSHKMGNAQSVNLVTKTIQEALKKKKADNGLVLHSDQDFQYTFHAYFRLTQAYDIISSMSRRGNCLDNACVENAYSSTQVCYYRRSQRSR